MIESINSTETRAGGWMRVRTVVQCARKHCARVAVVALHTRCSGKRADSHGLFSLPIVLPRWELGASHFRHGMEQLEGAECAKKKNAHE